MFLLLCMDVFENLRDQKTDRDISGFYETKIMNLLISIVTSKCL